jgi:hypothetical protein
MIEVYDKENKLIVVASIVGGNFVLVKCYIKYWRHCTSKLIGLTLELTTVKQLIKGKSIIKDNYNYHRFTI